MQTEKEETKACAYCSLNVSRINIGFVNEKHLGNEIIMWYIGGEFGDSF